ncbi:MAG: hypothetical protein KDD44_06065, partial [Bdellovibrionales bacterium]|nr:hypothetical protein [Bdellovibrionales bacterium]
FQVILLFLTVVLLPIGLVELIGGVALGFGQQLLQVILGSIGEVLAMGVWAGTFIMLLPVDARNEIGIEEYRDPASLFEPRRPRLLRYEGNVPLQISCVVISGLAFWLWMNGQLHAREFPPSVAVDVQSVEQKNDELVVSLRLLDEERDYRWLVPQEFRVELEPRSTVSSDTGESSEPSASPSEQSQETVPPAPDFGSLFSGPLGNGDARDLLRPTRIIALDASGVALDPGNLSPYDGPLELVLTFELPGTLREGEQAELLYHSLRGEPARLARLSIGTSW